MRYVKLFVAFKPSLSIMVTAIFEAKKQSVMNYVLSRRIGG